MMRHYEGADETRPEAAELFVASVMACFTAYLIMVSLFAISFFSEGPEAIASVIMVGASFGLFVAAFLTFIIIAPLATLIGIILLRALTAPIWLGAALGLLCAMLLLAGFFVLGYSGLPSMRDMPIFATFAAIAAFSGWVAQTYILRWPDLRVDADYI